MLKYDDIKDYLHFFGRTITDEAAVFFNWSGSGFEIAFEGTELEVCLAAINTFFIPEGTLWPWINIYIDGQKEPAIELCVDEPVKRITLFSGNTAGKHRIRVVKRSENDKGKVGLAGINLKGELLPCAPPKNRYKLEFIGDSITCGYGVMANSSDSGFSSREEDISFTYGAIASELMDADYHNISVSGISLCMPLEPGFMLRVPGFDNLSVGIRAMEDYYDYTDRLHEECRNKSHAYERWDFERFKPDAIVINLGTNDSYRIKAAADKAAEERHFEESYLRFIRKVRSLNGKKPVICCVLGSMDYYLYDNIIRAVDTYKNESDDDKVFCCKFGGIYPLEEGYGAGEHPSAISHKRMGAELCAVLSPLLNKIRTVAPCEG